MKNQLPPIDIKSVLRDFPGCGFLRANAGKDQKYGIMGVARIFWIMGGFLGIHGGNINPKLFLLQCNGFRAIAQSIQIFCRIANLQNSTKTSVDSLFLAQMSWNLDRRSISISSFWSHRNFWKNWKNQLSSWIINFFGSQAQYPLVGSGPKILDFFFYYWNHKRMNISLIQVHFLTIHMISHKLSIFPAIFEISAQNGYPSIHTFFIHSPPVGPFTLKIHLSGPCGVENNYINNKGDWEITKCYLQWPKTTSSWNFTHISRLCSDIPVPLILYLLDHLPWKFIWVGPVGWKVAI